MLIITYGGFSKTAMQRRLERKKKELEIEKDENGILE
jgi:hypothetical protein